MSEMSYREISKELGISPAALSLIVNHRPGVSDKTRMRVLEQLHEMGMDHLIKKEKMQAGSQISDNICFLVYKKTGEILNQHPFFLLLMESIEQEAAANGFNIVLNIVEERSTVQDQLQRLKESNPAGILIFATEMVEKDIVSFLRLPIPVLAIDNDFTNINCNSISINNAMGTWQAIEFLVRNGHHRIGYLRSSSVISSFVEREYGYRSALSHFGTPLQDNDVISVSYSEEGSYKDLSQILSARSDFPDAFVCDDDTIAAGALRAFREHGINIPEEISIIGFNDRPLCELTNPPLTTVNVSRRGLAKEAVRALVRMIKEKGTDASMDRSIKIRIGTKLTIRQSVKHI